MSDNSSSTGSSSSSNSWTILNPEEAAVESVGPVDDGTESLGDIPSLSEEMTVTMMETQPVETLLSEEGQQVCQETAPDASEGPIPSSPTLLSPSTTAHVPLDIDWDSQPPVIHDIMTSSPADNNDQLSAMPFVTNVNQLEPLHAPFAEPEPEESLAPEPQDTSAPEPEETSAPEPEESSAPEPQETSAPEPEKSSAPESPAPESAHSETPALDTPTDCALVPASPAVECPAPSLAEVSVPTETITPADVYTDSGPAPEREESVSPAHGSPPPETIGPAEPEEAPAVEKEETELPEKVEDVGMEEEPPSCFDIARGDTSAEEDGLRRRNVSSFEAPRRTSDEDDEEEEVEFKLAEKKEEKRGLSLNKLIVAGLVLLCLGSLFLSDDVDPSEPSDADQDQVMEELLDKLAQENQQISQIEAQLQSQKEELDSALKSASGTANEQGNGALEKENAKMKEELSSLPGLKEELETLRARVTELTHLTANHNAPAPPPSSSTPPAGQPGTSNQSAASPEKRRDPKEGGRLKEELHRQKVLLEESRKRLDGMKKDGGHKKGVRESLSEVQKRLSEQVEQLGKRKPWETAGSKWDAKKGKDSGKDHWKKEEKKGEKDRKHGKEKDKHDGGWKSHKQNSHKDAWRKYQDEWDRKKDERRSDREERKKERQFRSAENSDHHHHHHQHQPHRNHKHQPQQQNHHSQPQHHQPHQYDHAGFWEHQEAKLRRSVRPRASCGGTEDCAGAEGLYPVELSEFEGLLEGYLSKLEGAAPESKEEMRKLTARFFEDGVFIHDRALFGDFAGNVADILEDMADVLEDEGQEDDDALEEEMEEFEREALWKFGVTA